MSALSSIAVTRLKFLITSSSLLIKKPCIRSVGNLLIKPPVVLEVDKIKYIPSMQSHVLAQEDDSENLKEIKKFLRRMDVPVEKNMRLYKSVLKSHNVGLVKLRYYLLKEMGFNNITFEQIIVRFKSLMAMTVPMLQANGDLSYEIHSLDALISVIDGPPKLQDIIETKYSSLRDASLTSIHHIILLEYLIWKLQSNSEEILPLFQIYDTLKMVTLHSVMKMCKVLIEDIGFPVKKIQSNGFLLCLTPKKVLDTLNEFPCLANVPFMELVKKYPRILCASVDFLKKNEDLFKCHDITPTQIMKCGEVFLLHPDTVSSRLEALEKTPDLKEMKDHPQYLRLVYSYEVAMKRLELVKAEGFPITLPTLYTSKNRFQKFMSTPEDRLLRKNIIKYLAVHLEVDNTIIAYKLNSYFVDAKVNSMENVKKIFEFLEQNKFSTDDILKNIPLFMQEYETVKSNFDISISNLKRNKKKDMKYGRQYSGPNLTIDALLKS